MRTGNTARSPLFLRNRQLLVLSIVVALAAGSFATSKFRRFEDPRITNLFPIVITPFPGASSERVETLVTEKLEDELSEVDSILEMTSTSLAGVSVINIELAKTIGESRYREVFAEIRDKLDTAAAAFPEGAGPPVFDDKRDPAAFSHIIALQWTHDDEPQLGVLNRRAEDLADRIRAVAGTEMVRIYGAPEEELTVEADHAELAALGLDVGSLARLIAESDSKKPAGVLRGSRSDLLLEVDGEIDSLSRLRSIPVARGEAQSVVRVGDIASVSRGWKSPPGEIGMVDGRRAVLVAARMGRDRRIDVWSREVSGVVEDFRALVGAGVEVDLIFDQARYTNEQFSQLVGNLVLGVAVVLVVVFLLMGWRLGIVVGASLPIVVALTAFTLYLLGQSLHQMSVYGTVIALGLLIDNAIVIADEVKRRKTEGQSANQAVRGAVQHLFLPLLSSTATTALAFLPILLLPGAPGDFVSAIGQSVIVSVLWSFLLAMTVTAALAGLFADPTPKGARRRWWRDGLGSARLTGAYQWALNKGLRAPGVMIALALFLPLSGFMLLPSMGNSFFPPADRDMFEVRVWLPSTSPIRTTQTYAEEIEQALRQRDGVTRVFWMLGANFPRVYYNLPMDQDGSPHFAHAIVSTESNQATKRAIQGLQFVLEEQFPGAQVLVRQFRQGPPLTADVEYRVYGPEVSRLVEIGERIRLSLQSDPEVVLTQATMTRGEPKLWLEAKEDAAHVAGLSLGSIAEQLEASLEGRLGGTMIENLEEIPVRVRYRDARRAGTASVASTQLVRPEAGGWVPLAALGALSVRSEMAGTTRFNGVRTNIVKGFTTIDALPITVAQRTLDTLEGEGFELPPGYRLEVGGTADQEAETRGDLMQPLPIIGVFVAATLILTFKSTLLAGILGVIAIMSVGMAILSTWLIGFPISFNTFMGTFGLIGVALNDSIVVLAEIRANPRAAAGEVRGLIESVTHVTRHVISTTLTTIGGFLPLLLLVGGDFWPSMSIVLVGGIAGASIMALFFIPAAYRLLRRWVAPASAVQVQ